MSAQLTAQSTAQEPSAKYLVNLQPPLVRHFDLIAQAPGGVARLRELILTLAVQGKLVPQDPSDEPACELLQKIRVEKDRLIAEGKIKRDKPLAEIADEEKPFKLPVGWEWVRLSALAAFENGDRGSNYPSRSNFVDQGIAFINAGHLMDELIDYADMNYITPQNFDLLRSGKIQRGDILYCLRGSLGKFAQVTDDVAGAIASSLVIIRLTDKAIASYVMRYLKSPLAAKLIKRFDNGTAQPNLGAGDLAKFVVPLPPLPEQSRIVTRVEELMQVCDALEASGQLEAQQHAQLVGTLLGTLTQSETPEALADNWQRIATHFDVLLDRPEAVDALEQTILQLAVRGLLVPQDPTDEPASVLLQKIRTEKDHLIAQGKIKRDKPLPPITDEEKPFELPQGWEWARFPELGEFGRGKSKHRPRNDPALFNPPIYPVVQTGEVARAKGVIQAYHSRYSEIGLAQSRLWPEGTLCITIAANIADAALLGFDACFPDSVVGFVPAQTLGNAKYFLAFMETARNELIKFAPATAQKNINLEILGALLIPVPPLAEMSRIVTRVNELRSLCADLRQRLAALQSGQKQLATALIENAT
jgi:type I restriction enzyme, S subunit